MKLLNLLLAIGVTTTSMCFAQISRTVMVQSNNSELLYPLNFFTANAGVARVGLGLAAHATNPTVQITNGGSGATSAASARTNFGLVWSGLTNANASDFRSALGLPLTALTNTNAADFLSAVGVGATSSPTFGGISLTDGTNNLGLSATASVTRTNLGLTWSGLTNTTASGFRSALELSASWLTQTNVTNFRTAIGLGFTALTNATASDFRNAIGLSGYASNSIAFGIGGGITNTTNTSPPNQKNLILSSGGTNPVTVTLNESLGSLDVGGATVHLTAASGGFLGLGVGAAGNVNQVIFNGDSSSNAVGLYLMRTNYAIYFGTNNTSGAAITRTNLGLSLPALTNTNVTNFRTDIGLGATNDVTFNSVTVTNAAATRTNLGLPLAALTNTSNITLMRALSDSTNTNHPYSGSISVVGTNNTNTLVFSNGILQSVQ
jgi:hypothetical protein